MIKVLEYDDRYNINNFAYWSMKRDMCCTEGEIDGCWLVLSKNNECPVYRDLVDLKIVRKYEHNGIVYEVDENNDGIYDIIKQ